MKKLWSVLSFYTSIVFCFTIEGDPRSWSKEDFLGFDTVGDCTSSVGDISSVFSRVENDNLFLRVTFDDMFSRNTLDDRFIDEDLKIKVLIDSQSLLFNSYLDLENLSMTKSNYSYLRTPKYNLLEIQIELEPNFIQNNILYTIEVLHDQEIVDSFKSSQSENSRGGNTAFVHHGNQGLTYTEVFYGQEPLESRHVDACSRVA